MKTSELIEKINAADEWNMDDCEELCRRAGTESEWNAADADTFESVVYEAMNRFEA